MRAALATGVDSIATTCSVASDSPMTHVRGWEVARPSRAGGHRQTGQRGGQTGRARLRLGEPLVVVGDARIDRLIWAPPTRLSSRRSRSGR